MEKRIKKHIKPASIPNCILIIIFIIGFFLFTPNSVLAESVTGVAGTVSTDANSGCGDTNWGTATAANLNSNNTGYATITGNTWDNNNPTYRISMSNFGIAITNGYSIDGIQVDMLGWDAVGGNAVDQLVQLTKVAGTEVGSNYAKTSTYWPTSDPGTTYRNYGGSSDLWGTTWTESEVEATGFGLSVCLQAKAANQTFNMDHIRITVTATQHTTTLTDGTNPGDSTIAPGGSITSVNAGTLTSSSGTDPITSITVNLSTNSGVGTLTITDASDTSLGSIGGGTGSGIVTGSNSISITSTNATTGGTVFKVKVTPLSHSGMPSVPGGNYSITAPITDWTGGHTKAGQANDTSSTVTIDNSSPSGATSTSGSAGDAAVTLNWTTSSSSDFNTTSGSVIYRWAAGSAGSEVPSEGSTPSAGDTNSTATVACVISSSASSALSKTDGTGGSTGCTTTALTNGQDYTYKVFQKDTNGNYDAGVSIGTFTPAASGPPTCSSITTGNWSAVGTWGSGCSGANGQPIAGDIATVSAGDIVTVDSAQAASTITIESTGTLTFGSSSSLTLDGNTGTILTNNGSISAGSSSTVIFIGDSSPTAILGGSSTFTGSNAFYNLTLSPTIAAPVSYTMGAAFTANGGFTIDPTSTSTNALTVTLSGATTIGGLTDIKAESSATSELNTGSSQALTTGSIYIRLAGKLTANNSQITINGTTGPLFSRSAPSGSFVSNGSTVDFSESTADLTLTSSGGSLYFYNLVINLSGKTGTLGSTSTTVGNNLTINSGTLADGGTQITGNATGTFSIASGAGLTLGSSTVATTFPGTFTGAHISLNSGSTVTYASNQSQTISGTPTYGHLVISGTSTKTLGAAATIAGSLTISTGTLASGGYDINLAGNWINNSGYTAGAGTVVFNGTGSQSISGSATTTFNNLTDSNTSGTLSTSIDFTMGGALTVNASATFSASTGTATFNNGASISNSNSLTLYNMGVANSATVTTGSSFTISNTLSIGTSANFSPSAGTVTLSGGSIANSGTLAFTNVAISGTITTSSSFSVSGNWSNSGTFTASAGTITLNGADSSTQVISGNSTFYNLSATTAANSAGRTIQYASGSTTTISRTWTMNGASGKVLSLTPSSTTNWQVTPSTSSIDYVYLSRSTNNTGTICATHSTGDGNNTGYNITTGASCANSAPNTPTLDLPSDTATGQSITPSLLTTATDTNSDYLQYKIVLCENAGMSTNCQTFDETSNQTGWSGQNANGNTAYNSNSQAVYTVQSALENSKTYYWKSYALDPTPGSNTWSSTQVTPYSFTTMAEVIPGTINSQFKGVNLKGLTIQ